MPTLRDDVPLKEMLEMAKKAQAMVEGREREDLDTDDQLSLALQRLIEILGEAAKRVSAETRERAEDIPWKKIAGMRDRLIHQYWNVNLDIVWNTVTEELPPLVAALETLLGTES